MTKPPKHTKITTYTEQPDGSLLAVTDSYFEELSSRKEEVIKSVKTNSNNFLSDLMSSVDVVTARQTRELILRITLDELNNPAFITKQYTVRKDTFNKR